MHVVQLKLSRKSAATVSSSDADELLDALWAHSTEDDALEHVRLRADSEGIELVLFLREGPCGEPLPRSTVIVRRALHASERLSAKYAEPHQVPPQER